MLTTYKILQRWVIIMMMIFAQSKAGAQTSKPTWWFGVSGAANFNFYDGTTQRMNDA